MSSHCCPPGSAPSFEDSEYTPVGDLLSLPEVEYYAVGTPVAGGTAVLICPDIWGWNSGRTRRFADLLVNDVGISYVVIPKLLSPPFEGGTDGDALPPGFDLIARGSEAWPWLRDFKYETCLHPRLIALVDHLKTNLGISKIGGMGVCYGGWVIAHLTMHCPDISCCVIPHPSIHVEDSLHQGKSIEIVQKMTMPVLLMPAGNDPSTYQPGGEIYEYLVTKNGASKSVLFPDMKHGWTSRGDISNPEISRDVSEFWSLTVDFFNENLLRQ